MKCPLILMAWLHRTGAMPEKQADCFKGECAWFEPINSICSVRSIDAEINKLTTVLNGIKEKLEGRLDR